MGLSWGLWGVHPSQLALEGLVELCMAPRGIRQKRVRGVTVRAQGPGPPTGVKNTGRGREEPAGGQDHVCAGWPLGDGHGGGISLGRRRRSSQVQGTASGGEGRDRVR